MTRLALVTGAAGFIGSHLTDALLAEGWEVRGVDVFTDYYEPARKRDNLAAALRSEHFELHQLDLAHAELAPWVEGCDVVFHLAAQAGVRASWSQDFQQYVDGNVLGTQRLLDAARAVHVERFVHASSSSVYGSAVPYPTEESATLGPENPYGVTKLAAEHLCTAYAASFGLSTVSLRYFTVYGSRQRPDMAIHRMIESALGGPAFELYGDGSQVRDFTHVSDVVSATLRAAVARLSPGEVLNVAGGHQVPLLEVLEQVERCVGASVVVEHRPVAVGDVHRTAASIKAAADVLEWAPAVSLAEGLDEQVAWHRSRFAGGGGR